MTPIQHKKELNALIKKIDATTDGLIAYEGAVGVCTLSATAKARLASARLALSTLIESVADGRKNNK